VPDPMTIDRCELKVTDSGRVRAVQASLPADDVVDELAEVFGVLSDPNRLRLLASLLEGGELCVCDLAAVAGMAESTTSHALRLLRAHHVVKARRAGRMMHYSLRDGHVRMLLDVALEHVHHGEAPGPTASP
jgi:DNA-binding transcriptional ArsR family regulator